MNSQALPLILLAALAATSAQAAQYTVATQVDGVQLPLVQGTDTPAAASFGDPATASVQLGFSPLPSVMASSQTSAPNTVFVDGQPVYQYSGAQGQMVYSFQLSGAPGSTLDLHFEGAFRLSNAPAVYGVNQFSDSTRYYNIDNLAYANLNLWTDQAANSSSASGYWSLSNALATNYLPWVQTDFAANLSAGASLSSSANTALHQLVYEYVPEFYGSFQGSLPITLDATGFASGFVAMRASAQQNASAFIDPHLSIDPAYLQLHPEASLSFEPGVGNAAPVPEPATALSLLLGLGLLGWRRTARTRQTT